MPIKNGIGYGPYTEKKIEHLSKVIEMHLSITRSVLKKHPYYHQAYHYIDATAGKGSTPDGMIGSPIVFLERIESEKFQMNYRADFIECNDCNIFDLKKAIEIKAQNNNWKIPNLNFHPDFYEKVIPTLLPGEDDRELGLFFADPSGDMINFETVSYVAKARPRMDILLYVPTTNIKRLYDKNRKLLSDYMNDVGKSNWLIRKPFPSDSHKWTILLGSNTNIFGKYKRIDFLPLSSPEAQSFWPKLNLTKKQLFLQQQPGLFDDNEK